MVRKKGIVFIFLAQTKVVCLQQNLHFHYSLDLIETWFQKLHESVHFMGVIKQFVNGFFSVS